MPTIEIRCVEPDSKYVLKYQGAEWTESFRTIEAAVLHAGKFVVEETRLVIVDKDGGEMVVTTLGPLPPN